VTREEPLVSVVVPTRNRAVRLEAALDALAGQTVPLSRFEVIVVDDGSTDGTRDLLTAEQEAGRLTLRPIHLPGGDGPGHARNEGWRAARAPLVAFMDDDCEPVSAWLEEGLAAWGGDPERFVNGPTTPLPREQHLTGPFSYAMYVVEDDPAFPSCNIFYPKELLERVGGFDSSAFPGPQGEDTDLAWRVQAAGGRRLWAGAAEMHHAVIPLGPLGFLRRAWSWGNSMELVVRHPEFRRRRLVHRWFWNSSHYFFLRLCIALVLPRRRWLWPFKLWLARPYLRTYSRHPLTLKRSPALVPWRMLVDAVELTAVVRGSLRHGTLVL
jgi:glycosyltransferase involved in cell wall biosynthesis